MMCCINMYVGTSLLVRQKVEAVPTFLYTHALNDHIHHLLKPWHCTVYGR